MATLNPPNRLLGSLITARTFAAFIPKSVGPVKVSGWPYPTTSSPHVAVAVPTAATEKSP